MPGCKYRFTGIAPLPPRSSSPAPPALRNLRAIPLTSLHMLSETFLPSTSKNSLRMIYFRAPQVLALSFPHEGGKARVSAPARYCAFVRENDVLTLTMPMDKARFYRAGKGKMDEYYEDESLRDWVREEVDTEMKKRFGDRWRDSGKSDGFIEAKCKVLGNAKEEGGSAERLAHGFAEFVVELSSIPHSRQDRPHQQPLSRFGEFPEGSINSHMHRRGRNHNSSISSGMLSAHGKQHDTCNLHGRQIDRGNRDQNLNNLERGYNNQKINGDWRRNHPTVSVINNRRAPPPPPLILGGQKALPPATARNISSSNSQPSNHKNRNPRNEKDQSHQHPPPPPPPPPPPHNHQHQQQNGRRDQSQQCQLRYEREEGQMAVGQIPNSPSGKDKHSQCQPKKAPEPIFEEKELNFEPKLEEDLIDLFEFPEIEVELEVEEWRYCGSLLKRV